jgi:hypothetical protein
MIVAWFCHALKSPRGEEIVDEFRAAASEVQFPVEPFVLWATPGCWEDRTLNLMRLWAMENPGAAVLYTHTKGAYRNMRSQDLWRWEMTDRLLRAWPARLADLRDHDTAGVWWLTPEVMPTCVTTPYYPGNFWWARADYLATLPELPALSEISRGRAEEWLGRGNPRAKWMSQEWPRFTDRRTL